jgi:hypothetical protein
MDLNVVEKCFSTAKKHDALFKGAFTGRNRPKLLNTVGHMNGALQHLFALLDTSLARRLQRAIYVLLRHDPAT